MKSEIFNKMSGVLDQTNRSLLNRYVITFLNFLLLPFSIILITLFAYSVNTLAFIFMVSKFRGRGDPIKLDSQQPDFSRKIQNHATPLDTISFISQHLLSSYYTC